MTAPNTSGGTELLACASNVPNAPLQAQSDARSTLRHTESSYELTRLSGGLRAGARRAAVRKCETQRGAENAPLRR